MKWITRERPKIDRIACPWLILRFIDQHAEFFMCPLPMCSGSLAKPVQRPMTYLA